MANSTETSALEKLLRPLSREMSTELAQALIKVRADEDTQSRYQLLADKHTEGTLTADEAEELRSFVQANSVLGVLKIEAELFLAGQK